MVIPSFSTIRIPILITIFSIFSCAQADISISTANDKCTVTTEGQSVELHLTPPCELVKIDYKDHDYQQYDDSKVFIVAGQAIPIEQLSKWSVTTADKCSLQSQAVIVTKANVRLSAVRDGALTCPNIGLDEKVYRGFIE